MRRKKFALNIPDLRKTNICLYIYNTSQFAVCQQFFYKIYVFTNISLPFKLKYTFCVYNTSVNTLRAGDIMKVLIVDDEEMIRGVLKEYVEFEGGVAYEAADGMQAVKLCRDNDFDIILMDIMMPRLDGFSAVKEIKKFKDIPVIMLSARSEEYDKLFGFEIGVDDYVTKPFSPKEVMARINAVLKRKNNEDSNKDVVTFEGLTIDMVGRNVYVDGEKAELTPKEYEILFYFVKNKNIALTREKLLMDVWGFDFYGDDRTVDTHIKMLRSNLKQYRKFIVTLRGMGYKFEV